MKLILGVMYLHVHGTGGGDIGRLAPMLENKHLPYSAFALNLENKYLYYFRMGFHRI